jgi:hypothetical protein
VFCLPLPEVNAVKSVSGTLCGHPFCFDALDAADSDAARNARLVGWNEGRACLDLLPPVLEPFQQEEDRLDASLNLPAPDPAVDALLPSSRTRIDRRLLPVAVFLLPFRTLQYYHTLKHPNRPVNAVTYIMREGIKFKSADATVMTTLMENVESLASFLRQQQTLQKQRREQPQDPAEELPWRLEAGMLLRTLKESWVTCLLLATVLLQRQSQLVDPEHWQEQQDKRENEAPDWLSTALFVYKQVMHVHKLDQSWTARPLIDGSELSRVLRVPKGPLVARYLREQVQWMLLNPGGTREGCEAHLALLHKRRLEEANAEPGGRSSAASSDDDCGKDEMMLGVSDGTGKTPSSPASGRKGTARHFSKKMHVESMDLT